MSNNVNSFAQNVDSIVNAANQSIAILQGIQESLITDKDSVTVNIQDSSSNLISYDIPSYQKVIQDVNALKKSVDSFVNGSGVVNVNDGTYRQVSATPIAAAPPRIIGIQNPTSFFINPNWLFDSLMFPRTCVRIDLKGKIDDNADRIRMNRVIIDATIPGIQDFYANNILGKNLSYVQLINLLNSNGIGYSEDLDTIDLPLSRSSFQGTFNVQNIEIIDGNIWYTVDNLNYYLVNDDGTYGANLLLSLGNTLSLNNTLFEVIDLNVPAKKIRLKATLGYTTPGMNASFSLYNIPYSAKIAEIPFGYNEINVVYLKGINENFNLISDNWSEPISFISNNLIFAGNGTQDFKSYYLSAVSDFGANWIADAKERKIKAFYGYVPNSPVLSPEYFSVVQINTQFNAALDSEEVKSLSKEIETTKTNITSIKDTIAALKAEAQTTSDATAYNNIQKKINSNTLELNQLQVSYRTMLQTLQDLVYENEGVDVSPKYRVRGFFPIPEPRYSDETNKIGPQRVIGFDIAYRYLKLDNTGNDLKTYTYNINGQEYSGIYSDWNMVTSRYLSKVYNSATNMYEWISESIADGNTININQIDIPINKGEKVEIKIRSISEAGFPDNPLKSLWSDSIIMEFPSNLSTGNTLANLIKDANDEQTNIVIDETLNAIGVFTHLNDSVPNPDSVNDEAFKHNSENIFYNFGYTEDNLSKVKSTSVDNILDKILAFFDNADVQVNGKTLREFIASRKN